MRNQYYSTESGCENVVARTKKEHFGVYFEFLVGQQP
jgi:hypothetical protein